MKNKYLCKFQKLIRAFLIFAMFATSSQIAAAQLNVALSNARLGKMCIRDRSESDINRPLRNGTSDPLCRVAGRYRNRKRH